MPSDPETVRRLRADPHFRSLARSLWGETEVRGAALMVGAGMSRNAVRVDPTSPRPPLWGELLRGMCADLAMRPEDAPGALRLAQRYEDEFGRGRLEGLVRALVADDAWEPGLVHERLLALPWTDVLTTNYDTLLERAARRLVRTAYERVLTPEDIARTRPPRIVKLHGTLPSHTPFVLTEADYRDYPSRSAPFVNLARQVILENDLLMVGFSGDDPNFAAWTGWVRAEVAPYARPIFLAGPLDLDGQARDRLRERGIVAIDLGPVVPGRDGDRDRRNAVALELMLDALEDARPLPPRDWSSSGPWPAPVRPPDGPDRPWEDLSDSDFATRYVTACASRWRSERATYPGWLEPPRAVAETVRLELSDHLAALRAGTAALAADERVAALADVAWRADLVHASLSEPELAWLEEAVRAVDADRLGSDDRVVLGRLLARERREREDEAGFARWTDWLSDAAGDREAAAWAAYERALWWRDRLAYDRLRAALPAVRGDDPAWHLRRGALWAELGMSREATAAVREAWMALTADASRTRRSLWLRSRLAWTAWVASATTVWTDPGERVAEFVTAGLHRMDPATFDETCDPWQVVEGLDEAVAAAEARRAEDRGSTLPEFDLGVTRGPGVVLRSREVVAADRLVCRVVDRVGMPPFAGSHASVAAGRLQRAAATSDGGGRLDALRRLLAASRRPKVPEEGFDRLSLARMEGATVAELAERAEAAVATLVREARAAPPGARTARGPTPSASTLLELLSRFVVRLEPDRVEAVLSRAFDLAREAAVAAHDASRPLGNLVRRAVDALPPQRRGAFLADLAAFPLPSEKGVDRGPTDWPNPLLALEDVAAEFGPALSQAVGRLMSAASGDHAADAPAAVLRLARLCRLGCLTDGERAAFGALAWERRRSGEARRAWGPASVVALCEAPRPDPAEASALLRSIVPRGMFGDAGQAFPDVLRLVRRLAGPRGGGLVDALGPEGVAEAAEALLAWRPQPADGAVPDLFGASTRLRDVQSDEVARTLVEALLPALSRDAIGDGRQLRWAGLARVTPRRARVVCLPQLVRLGVASIEEASDELQEALLDGDGGTVRRGLEAVRDWSSADEGPTLPGVLADEVAGLVATRATRALADALRTATLLVDAGVPSVEGMRRLRVGLALLSSEATYDDGPHRVDASVVGPVRVAAVDLAGAIVRAGADDGTAGRWLEAGRVDPMPEVRRRAVAAAAAPAGPAAAEDP